MNDGDTHTAPSSAESTMEEISNCQNSRSCRRRHVTLNKAQSSKAVPEAGGDEDFEDQHPEMWKTFNSSFQEVQSVLDRNRVLIQQVNENHRSKSHGNLVQNVSLINEINGNVSKVVSLYSDLSVNISGMFPDPNSAIQSNRKKSKT